MSDASILVFVREARPREVNVHLQGTQQPDLVWAADRLGDLSAGKLLPGPWSWGSFGFDAEDRVVLIEFDGIAPHVEEHCRRLAPLHLLSAAEWLRGRIMVQYVAEGVVTGMQQLAQMQREAQTLRGILVPDNGRQ